jgi:hypothetical protein
VKDEPLECLAALRDDEQADRRPAGDERFFDRPPPGNELFARIQQAYQRWGGWPTVLGRPRPARFAASVPRRVRRPTVRAIPTAEVGPPIRAVVRRIE